MTATGERLRPHGMAAPLVVIANYVFDGLPQDAFQVENGILLERLVAVAAPAGAQDADVLDNIDLVWRLEPAATPCYQDADWNALLEQYRARLPKASFLFPVAALAGLDRLRRLTDGPLALLIADKGTDRDQDLLDHDVVPTLTRHGSVSMMVDCQLIGALARRRGGVALHPRHRSRALNVSALLFGETQDGWRETELAYRQAVDRFGPDDLVSIRDAVEGGYERMSVTEIIAFLRLCAWDHRRFLVAVPALRRQAQALPDRERRELLELVRAVWSDFLPIGEEDDLAFEIGVLLVDLGLQAEALEFFEASVELYGSTAATSYNMALCHWAGQRPAAARAAVDAALALAPEFAAASELRQRIEAAAQDAADTTRSWLR
jgi:tetratricopeptide (TPR) repeat protein